MAGIPHPQTPFPGPHMLSDFTVSKSIITNCTACTACTAVSDVHLSTRTYFKILEICI